MTKAAASLTTCMSWRKHRDPSRIYKNKRSRQNNNFEHIRLHRTTPSTLPRRTRDCNMDVPSVTVELSKMAVPRDTTGDRTDSVAPDCTAPDVPTESNTLDAPPPDSTAPKSAPITTSSFDLPKSSRPRAVSAYRRPGSIDATPGSRSNSAFSLESEEVSPSKLEIATTSKPLISPLKATASDFVPSPRGPQPDAPEFTPSSHKTPTPAPLFEVRASPRGGSGVFATQNIFMGTRIICDPPLLKISWNHLYLAWGPYCRLRNSQKQEYDTLYFWKNNELHLEQASRMNLLDPTDDAIESDDEEEIIAEHVRVMGIFAVNNFQMSGGALGIFSNAARLNHSCVPNVHHSYNSTLDKLTVHALRDIYEGEELLMNYIGAECHFWNHQKRWDYLRSRYGFTCQCPACSDTTGLSDDRHELLSALIWGLEQFQKGVPAAESPLIPDSGIAAIQQAEHVITVLLDQGLWGIELIRAYRLAASISVDVGEYERALEFASNEAEVERNIFGTEIDDLRKSGAASELWIKQLYRTTTSKGFKPYVDLAIKIFKITGVRHEVLDEKQQQQKKLKKQQSQTPRKGKKHKYQSKIFSPAKQGISGEKEDAVTPQKKEDN